MQLSIVNRSYLSNPNTSYLCNERALQENRICLLSTLRRPKVGQEQGWIQSWTFGGLNCLFNVKSSLILCFAIGDVAVWVEAMTLDPPRSSHGQENLIF